MFSFVESLVNFAAFEKHETHKRLLCYHDGMIFSCNPQNILFGKQTEINVLHKESCNISHPVNRC